MSVRSFKLKINLKQKYKPVFYTYLILSIIFTIFLVFFPIFRSGKNISNLLVQIAPLAIVAIGQAIVIIGGGVDLSVGAVISSTSVIAANFMGVSVLATLITLICIFAFAAFIGYINGLICNETHIPPLIATLSTASIIQGLILLYRETPGGSIPKFFSNFILFRFGVISTPIIMVVVLNIFFIYMMSRSSHGLYTYSIGGNEAYAHMVGINIKKVRIGNYIISAILSSMAGLILTCRIGSGSSLLGAPFVLDSITAVIIGGITFAGGLGFVSGALAGACIIAMLSNALNISGVSPFYQYIVKGALLLIAMMVSSKRKL